MTPEQYAQTEAFLGVAEQALSILGSNQDNIDFLKLATKAMSDEMDRQSEAHRLREMPWLAVDSSIQ